MSATFERSEEQQALAGSLQKLFAAPHDWSALVAMGLTALPFAEAHGGLAAGPAETAVVMEEIGRALSPMPYLAHIVLAGAALRLGATAAQQAALVPAIAAGERRAALAWAEAGGRYATSAIGCAARETADGWVLDGAKLAVPGGAEAETLIIAARFAGQPGDEAGIGLFVVGADAPGLARRAYVALDGSPLAELGLAATRAEPLGAPADGHATLVRAIEHGIAAASAESIGVMQAIQALTLDYLRTRRQFGRPIGEFQVLQHRAVDMYVALEQARSMAWLATAALDEADDAARARAIAAARVQVGRSLRHVAEEAVQLHGGIGVTMEYRLGALVRRAAVLATLFGDADHHLRRLASMGSLYTT